MSAIPAVLNSTQSFVADSAWDSALLTSCGKGAFPGEFGSSGRPSLASNDPILAHQIQQLGAEHGDGPSRAAQCIEASSAPSAVKVSNIYALYPSWAPSIIAGEIDARADLVSSKWPVSRVAMPRGSPAFDVPKQAVERETCPSPPARFRQIPADGIRSGSKA
jgi:hypothetical protein